MGPQLPSPNKGADPQFSAHFYCRQTAGCIKMPLGMEVGLSPGDFALDGDPASLPLKGHSSPIFVRCSLWPNDWMDEDITWYGNRPRPRPHCIRRGPSSARKGHSSPHLFGPCLLWPRSPISATAELLSHFNRSRFVCSHNVLKMNAEKTDTISWPVDQSIKQTWTTPAIVGRIWVADAMRLVVIVLQGSYGNGN